MNDVFQGFTFTHWFLLIQFIVCMLWVGAQAWRFVIHSLLRFITGRTPKGRVANAVNDILAVYGTPKGQKLTVVINDGWELAIIKRSERPNDN